MKMIDGEMWFTKKEVAELVGRSALTIHYYDNWSNEREELGLDRFIPKPKLLGKYRFWSKDDIDKIKEFIVYIDEHRGSMAKYNKRLWGKKEATKV